MSRSGRAKSWRRAGIDGSPKFTAAVVQSASVSCSSANVDLLITGRDDLP